MGPELRNAHGQLYRSKTFDLKARARRRREMLSDDQRARDQTDDPCREHGAADDFRPLPAPARRFIRPAFGAIGVHQNRRARD
jgi:hypothetical protein